jgi:hypothetical protein
MGDLEDRILRQNVPGRWSNFLEDKVGERSHDEDAGMDRYETGRGGHDDDYDDDDAEGR